MVIVSAPAGAVAADEGDVAGLPVCLQQASRDAVRSIFETSAAFGGDAIKTLVDGLVAADGSFALQVDASSIDGELLMAVNVAGDCLATSASTWTPSSNSIVFKDLSQGGGFGGASAYFPELMPGESTTLCAQQDETLGCNEPFVFLAEDEAGNRIITVNVTIWRSDTSPTVEPDDPSGGGVKEDEDPALALTLDDGSSEANGGVKPSDEPSQKMTLTYGETYWFHPGEVHVTFDAEDHQLVDVTLATGEDWGKVIVLPRSD